MIHPARKLMPGRNAGAQRGGRLRRPPRCVRLAALCLLTMLSARHACAAEQERPANEPWQELPWLDKPMRRFASCYPGGTPWNIDLVFSQFAKQARVRASLEYNCDLPREQHDDVDLYFRLPHATPRQVLSEIRRRWAPIDELVPSRQGGFLCLTPRSFLDDPDWPLNSNHVEGFSVEDASFYEVLAKLVATLRASTLDGHGPTPKWDVCTRCMRMASGFGVVRENMPERITATVRSGTARSLVCQVASLLPRGFWGAEDLWLPDPDAQGGKRRTCVLRFAVWRDCTRLSSEELVRMLIRHWRGKASAEDWRLSVLDIAAELLVRGGSAAEALADAYAVAEDPAMKEELLWTMLDVCVWPDAARVLEPFARRARAAETDPEVIEMLQIVEGSSATIQAGRPVRISPKAIREREDALRRSE